tara:strand:+ start:1299 stop:1541 length:243 start_codon:yes stop_codon:yes gene_type:complete
MTVNYSGESVKVAYEDRKRVYSRPPVSIVKVCKYGTKRPIQELHCPCLKCNPIQPSISKVELNKTYGKESAIKEVELWWV